MSIDPTIIRFLSIPRKILITTHVRPDGDAVGSSLALFHFLKSKGHNAMLAFPSGFADYHRWFPGIEEVIIFPYNKGKVENFLKNTEMIVAVDFNDLKRNAELGKLLAEQSQPKLLLDHHPEPTDTFKYMVWDTRYCASGEAVFDLIEALDPILLKDKTIACCIYGAIVSDSGSFRFPSVTEKTFQIASKLLESGIDHSQIQREIYDNFSEKRLRFWGYCINERMTILEEFKTAYITISKDDFKKFETKTSDTENLVNFAMSIRNIEISILIIEHDGFIKLSFRSKNDFPVNNLAKNHFNGGGHLNAAGGETKTTIDETVVLLNETLKLYIQKSEGRG